MKLISILLFACLTVQAAVRQPSLTGRWRLDVEQSKFARQAPPKSRVTIIEHRHPSLRMTIEEDAEDGRSVKGSVQFTTDGRPAVNEVQGNPLTTVSGWEGKILYMKTTGNYSGNPIVLEERYELSKDKRVLTIRRHYEGQRGGVQDQVLVNRRERWPSRNRAPRRTKAASPPRHLVEPRPATQ